MRCCKVHSWATFGFALLLALLIPLWTRCICPPRCLETAVGGFRVFLIIGKYLSCGCQVYIILQPRGEIVLLRIIEADEIIDCQTSGEVSSLGLPQWSICRPRCRRAILNCSSSSSQTTQPASSLSMSPNVPVCGWWSLTRRGPR